jgi:hypothetical protein
MHSRAFFRIPLKEGSELLLSVRPRFDVAALIEVEITLGVAFAGVSRNDLLHSDFTCRLRNEGGNSFAAEWSRAYRKMRDGNNGAHAYV